MYFLKAFDIVDHNILSNVLKAHGVSGMEYGRLNIKATCLTGSHMSVS